VRYRFVHEHLQQFPIARLCRVMKVSPSGYYAWRQRKESARAQAQAELVEAIRAIHLASRGTYGWRRVRQQLRQEGRLCSRHRLVRLMRQHGLQGRRPTRRVPRTTDSRHALPVAPNRLAGQPPVQAPNQVWGSDITYLPTEEGWLYLATVMDLASRRIVGWSMQTSLARHLPLQALQMALEQRHPAPGLVHHSDRGSQYASHDYQALLAQHGLLCSMSRRGDPYDNAAQESFFARLKGELPQRRWPTRSQARREVFEYIEVFYNRKRLHSSLGYLSPADFERQSQLRVA
jgi:putative transposase